MKILRLGTFSSIVASILKDMGKEPPWGKFVGRERERRVEVALKNLERENAILGFTGAGKLSYADVKKGVDFYVVVMGRCRREVVELSVTGPRWVKVHLQKHPHVPVISVKVNEQIENIEEKIRGALNAALLSAN